MNLTSLIKEYQAIIENKPSMEDLDNISKLIRSPSAINLLELRSKEQLEVVQSVNKTIQDTLETLNSLGIMKMKKSTLQSINELIMAQKRIKEDQIKVLKSIQENANRESLSLKQIKEYLKEKLESTKFKEDLEAQKKLIIK
jgi:hypothetical protein